MVVHSRAPKPKSSDKAKPGICASAPAPPSPEAQIYRLLLSCPNCPGIVARVAGHIFEAGFNIGDLRQFDELDTNRFFMRIEFNPVRADADVEAWRASFSRLAEEFGMDWNLCAAWRGPR